MKSNLKTIATYYTIMIILPVLVSVLIRLPIVQSSINISLNETSVTLFINITAYTILPAACIIFHKNEYISGFKNINNHLKKIIPLIILLYICSLIGNLIISYFDHALITDNQNMIYEMKEKNFYITAYMVSIAAPVTEETVFRCSMISNLKGIKMIFMAILSSLLFALAHLQGNTPGAFAAYAIMGMLFAIIYARYRNIILNILIHAIYNSLAIAITEFL